MIRNRKLHFLIKTITHPGPTFLYMFLCLSLLAFLILRGFLLYFHKLQRSPRSRSYIYMHLGKGVSEEPSDNVVVRLLSVQKFKWGGDLIIKEETRDAPDVRTFTFVCSTPSRPHGLSHPSTSGASDPTSPPTRVRTPHPTATFQTPEWEASKLRTDRGPSL